MIPNLGFGHLVVIIVVGLIVFGPNKLPELMRKLGKAWRVVQAEAEKAQAQFKVSLDPEPEAPTVSTAVVHDTPDAMAIANEAAAEPIAQAHTPKPRKAPAKKTGAQKTLAKKTTAKKITKKGAARKPKLQAPLYPLEEDT